MIKLTKSAALAGIAVCLLFASQNAAISTDHQNSHLVGNMADLSMQSADLQKSRFGKSASDGLPPSFAKQLENKPVRKVIYQPEQDIVVFENQKYRLITQGDVRKGISLLTAQ